MPSHYEEMFFENMPNVKIFFQLGRMGIASNGAQKDACILYSLLIQPNFRENLSSSHWTCLMYPPQLVGAMYED